MPFRNMLRDTIAIVKADGRRFENVSASVQSGRIIFMAANELEVEDGDTIERVLPSGIREEYLILDAGYYSGRGGIPASYQTRVRKKSALPSSDQPGQVIYNLIGANTRVNIQSRDASHNVVSITPGNLFEEMRSALASSIEDAAERERLLKTVSDLERTRATPDYTERYVQFVAAAANHMTVLQPFMPALAQLLTGTS